MHARHLLEWKIAKYVSVILTVNQAHGAGGVLAQPPVTRVDQMSVGAWQNALGLLGSYHHTLGSRRTPPVQQFRQLRLVSVQGPAQLIAKQANGVFGASVL
jgi:hypothetical protein